MSGYGRKLFSKGITNAYFLWHTQNTNACCDAFVHDLSVTGLERVATVFWDTLAELKGEICPIFWCSWGHQPFSSACRARLINSPCPGKPRKILSCSAPKKVRDSQRGISLPPPGQAPAAARGGSLPGLGETPGTARGQHSRCAAASPPSHQTASWLRLPSLTLEIPEENITSAQLKYFNGNTAKSQLPSVCLRATRPPKTLVYLILSFIEDTKRLI